MFPALTLALVSSLLLAVVGTAVMFLGRGRGLRTQPGVRASLAAVVAGLVTLGTGAVLGVRPTTAGAAALLLAAGVLCWTRVARDWTARGLLAWSMTVAAGLLFLAWVGAWTVTAAMTPVERAASSLLWLLEAFVFVLAIGHVWELVDVVARRRWRRRVVPAATGSRTGPFVSLHVPTHNEPPDLVIATLQSLLAQEYDDYEILLVDNNTTDPELWRPVEEFCTHHDRIRFLHLEDWPGYKSGALNHALELVDPHTTVVGVIDADYQAEPDFLARCAPLFADPGLGFVQTPQDYREWEFSGYFRRLYYSYQYFFDVSQVSRNERSAPIFGGTMGLIRRDALVGSGGWDEWCITEDAELSLRLLRDGWTGTHVDKSFGHGIMPLTFEAVKRQRFRWCFGGIQILRLHWRSLLPGRRTDRNALTPAQRWAYLVGGLQWFGDLAGLAFTGFLLMAAVDLTFGGGLVQRRLTPLLLLCLAALVVLGMVRSVALLHRIGGIGWRASAGAFGIWLGLGWSVALGVVRGLVSREGVFLRTPKVRGEAGWMDALRGNRVETALALVCLAGAGLALTEPVWGAALIAGLLLVQGGGYAAAPLNSIAAMRSWLPVDLRPRRFDGLLSWTRAAQPVRRGGLVLAGVSVSLVGLVVFAAPLSGPLPPGLPGEDEEPLTEPAPTPTLVPTTGTEAPRATAPVSTVGSTPPGTTTTGVPSPVATTAPATTASAADQPAQADPPAPEPTPTQATQPAEVTQPPQATQPAQASRRPSPPEPPDPSGGRP